MGRRRGLAAETVRWPWTGWCGAPPGPLTRREDTSGPCEGGIGVKEALRSTAARNCAAAQLTGDDAGRKSGRGRGGFGASGLGEGSWWHGGVVAGSCGVGGAAVWRGRGGAEGSARRSEQSGMGAALGFVGRRSVGLGEGAEDWGRFKGGRPGISAWEQGRKSRRTRRDSGAGVALRGRRSWQAGPGCSERRGALARWRGGVQVAAGLSARGATREQAGWRAGGPGRERARGRWAAWAEGGGGLGRVSRFGFGSWVLGCYGFSIFPFYF
jgi:hypothetical protein